MSPRNKEVNTLSFAILGFFLEKPYHGYELYKHMSQSVEFKGIWRIKQSLFYGYLDKFFQEGYLDQRILEGDPYPARKEYSLTDEGKKFILSWIEKPVIHGREMRQEFLAKLFFAMKLDLQKGLSLIDNQKVECESWLDQISFAEEPNHSTYQSLIFQYRIRQIQAMIDWLQYVALNSNHLVSRLEQE